MIFLHKKIEAKRTLLRRGAGGRTRTGTVSPPVDFESTTSANSITPAQKCFDLTEEHSYYILNGLKSQDLYFIFSFLTFLLADRTQFYFMALYCKIIPS